jgi:hypothetical protein
MRRKMKDEKRWQDVERRRDMERVDVLPLCQE